LRRLRTEWEGPWLACGDFNETLHQYEHVGPWERSKTQMSLFKDCLSDCGLIDLGYSGPLFTWSNKQDGDDLVRVRLDRAVANGSFMAEYDDCTIENLITTTSDHLAILVKLQSFAAQADRQPIKSGFRYEAAWVRASDYRETMERAWSDSSGGPHSLQSTWELLVRCSMTLIWVCRPVLVGRQRARSKLFWTEHGSV
jgi:hypothetical protein